MSADGPARRRKIEDSTAARLAEIVAAAEQAAKRVIDEAEAEARTRLDDASDEADRIVAERLAGLAELTDEVGAQAAELVARAEDLRLALARVKVELGGDAEALGGSAATGRRESDSDPEARRPLGPSLTVVGGMVVEDDTAPAVGGEPNVEGPRAPMGGRNGDDEPRSDAAEDAMTPIGSPAGARLLATQMAVSGSSRDEIEARLRNGFAIADPQSILDAILGPEN